MILIATILLIAQCGAANLDFLKILLSGNLEELHKLSNPRQAIIQSAGVLKTIDLSDYDTKLIWEAFKGDSGPQNITADELSNIIDILHVIPEDDLCHLNLTDWTIIETLGKVDTFSRSQVSVLADALKIQHGLNALTRADSLNHLSNLICGFSEDDLSKIPKHDFKKIKSKVFANLNACSNSQLRVLHDKVVNAYGEPQTWSASLLKHIGIVLISLTKNEIQSLRPLTLRGVNIDLIRQHKPDLLHAFTSEQLKVLIMPEPPFQTVNSRPRASELQEICFLMGLFLRAYLLLKF